ncbi:MAG: hypothetical protein Q3999_00335, partial [Buchananella hordeovulneris]|nr:hypothetical protein [Buchananella hordeovulneris]
MSFTASVLPAFANAALALLPIPTVYRRALGIAQVTANRGNYAASWHLNRRIAAATNTDQLVSSPARAAVSPLHTFGLLARVRMAKQVVAGQAPASRGQIVAELAGEPTAVWHRVTAAALAHLDALYAAGRLANPSKEELDLAWETLALAFDPAIQQRAGAPLVESDSLMRELLSGPFVSSLTRPALSATPRVDDVPPTAP